MTPHGCRNWVSKCRKKKMNGMVIAKKMFLTFLQGKTEKKTMCKFSNFFEFLINDQ